ncbi:hypothetical protein [Desulforamulus ruminis]|uniref:Uncharacterized protein n=1 Tax=Desulforamulus ruminis (strain ATCC 23193 / DSM 2154 / NCIMB 8452 / DL) TaxID=696281 RepID=F6DSA3_DESRL|nr:hypothetical protein [Desulforamulus ruminis]AEG59882.1 hypothetical protein Desru_1617 [Desulforamulus ruminis DSM 2154]
MSKRFIIRKELVENLDATTMKSFIHKVLDDIDACQSSQPFAPNLEKLGHEVLRAAFEIGLVHLDNGCPGCSGSCSADSTAPEEAKPSNHTCKVIPFKKLH